MRDYMMILHQRFCREPECGICRNRQRSPNKN